MAGVSWLESAVTGESGHAPSTRARFGFAVAMGIFGVLLCYGRHLAMPAHPGDFGLSWFGARSLLNGQNPYELVGPGRPYPWPWPLVYPGTAFVAALPVAWLPEFPAILIFVFMSCALLGYATTKTGWARVPLFGSAPFVIAAGSAQWSPLFTAAMTIPALGFFFAAKPTIGFAMGVTGSERLQKFVVAGGVILVVVSIAMFPRWPLVWLGQLHYATQMAPSFLRLGGLAIAAAAFRWRRPEARLILALACVPQVGAWYDALPLFLAAFTYRETMILALSSSVGYLIHMRLNLPTEFEANRVGGALMVAFAYLPATIMVLRRPNTGELPWWLRWIDRSARVD